VIKAEPAAQVVEIVEKMPEPETTTGWVPVNKNEEETIRRAKENFANRTDEEKAEMQKPSVYAESEYHGPPVMGVDKKTEIKEEQPKVEAPIVESEKPKLVSFHGMTLIKSAAVLMSTMLMPI